MTSEKDHDVDRAEISVVVADSIASWRRIFAGRNGADARTLLRRAAGDLFETLEINRTVYPQSQGVARQEVVDALADMADVSGIGPDEAQYIFAEVLQVSCAEQRQQDQQP